MPDAAKLAYLAPGGLRCIFVEEPETFLDPARGMSGVAVFNEAGEIVGTFTLALPHVWDDATGTPAEDAEDIRLAGLAMREEGSIPFEELEAELRA